MSGTFRAAILHFVQTPAIRIGAIQQPGHRAVQRRGSNEDLVTVTPDGVTLASKEGSRHPYEFFIPSEEIRALKVDGRWRRYIIWLEARETNGLSFGSRADMTAALDLLRRELRGVQGA